MWGAGRLQVHGICRRRLVYRQIVEAWSNYKKYYLRWFRNLAFGDSSRSNWIEKDWFHVSPVLVWGNGKRWYDLAYVEYLVYRAPLDDWASGGSVDVFFTYGKYGFSSMVLIMLHYFREVKCQQSYTPGIWCEVYVLG